MKLFKIVKFILLFCSVFISACYYPLLDKEADVISDYTYKIGPGDTVQIFVWGNPDVTTSVPVRPDGKITVPLVEDVQAMGKTPYELARKMEREYQTFIRDPQVYIMVSSFQGVDSQQIRIIGQIGGGGGGGSGGFSSGGGVSGGGSTGSNSYRGQSVPYRRGMTLLDVIIEIGTIGNFADGNRASIIREVNGEQRQFGVRMDDLAQDGNMAFNVEMRPGDILVIPEAFF